MTNPRIALVLTAAMAALAMSAFAQDMSPGEIQEAWVGKSISGATSQGKSFTMTLKADGSVAISGEAANDTGTWRLSDSGYCAKWNKIRQGQERCFTVRRADGGVATVLNPDGTVSAHVSKVE